MAWQRCALLLATGAAGIVVSSTFGGDPKAAALAVAGSSAILNIGSGFIQNGLQSSYESVVAAITGRARTGNGLPINHDLARAIRRSHLDAITYLLEGFEADVRNPWANRSHRPDFSPFLKAARAWIKAEQKLTERADFAAVGTHDQIIGEVREVIEQACITAPDTALSLISDAAQREAYAEFEQAIHEAGREVPPEFVSYFSGTTDLLRWSLAAQAFFAQRLKDDERVRTVVFLDRFNALGRGQAEIIQSLVGLRSAAGDLADRLTAIESKLDAVLTRAPGQTILEPAALANDLATAIAAGSLPEQIVRRLLIAHSSIHSVAQTALQVRERVDELTERFFGRTEVFQTLDEFADSRNSGILILTAPAGRGKSACLANWVARRCRNDAHLVYHFISGNKPLTTSIAEISGHLAGQLSLSSGVGSESGVVRSQNLFALLQNARDPVTLVLDGLDEASSLVQPFVEAGALPPHVRIILSARAQEAEWPHYLTVWRRLEQPDFAVKRIDLPPLSAAEALLWLEDYVGHLEATEMERLATQLHHASDGVPLFLSFILEDFLKALPTVDSAEERRRLISEVPAPFDDYLRAEMDRPARTGEGEIDWGTDHRRLFALLSTLRGPIKFRELAAIAPGRYPDLRGLPQRFARWLAVGNSEDDETIAFAHPRLAKAFGSVLHHEAGDEELCLLEWTRGAWPARGTKVRPLPGAAYPLDWLPEHLLAWGEQTEAAELLTNPEFLFSRLNDPAFGAARLASHIECWFSISREHWPDDGYQWDAAWVENESRLVAIANTSAFARNHLNQTVRDCLADCGVTRMGRSRAVAPHCPLKENLLRSHDTAHRDLVRGVLPVDEKLVSWGDDGAIHFWSMQGVRLLGGDDQAHRNGIAGVSAIEERLVSWGNDGSIRFWSREGDRLPGGQVQAHQGHVQGVLPLDQNLVSWGSDGAIRFWNRDGKRLPGGDDEAHYGWSTIVELVDQHLVSLGSDGAIRFWSRFGDRLPGGDDQAHEGLVQGLLQVDDRLFSWDSDGAIHCWSRLGDRLPGGDEHAHQDAVAGMLAIDPHLVSWGRDGAIRFWSRQGDRLPVGENEAHKGPIQGVLSVDRHLVSWGSDGAIRFWSQQGDRLPGGDDQAHQSPILGMLPIDDKLVSWDSNGAIHFWSRLGERLPGGDDRAHQGWVAGVLAVDQQLISWGEDGAIRFWSIECDTLPGAGDELHQCSVRGLLAIDEKLVTWDGDGAIRFWDQQGSRLPGGDDAAHRGAVRGVLPVDDHLVSWGEDGAIRCWTRQGARLPEGNDRAHEADILGMLPVDQHLVSWDSNGAIRFWSKNGSRLPGGHDEAHRGWVAGVLAVDQLLVSWDSDGAICCWSRQGARMPGGHDEAHDNLIRGVLSVDQHFVSWDLDGEMRFWSQQFDQMPGGATKGDKGWVTGAIAVDQNVISWSDDGKIRFWSQQGDRLLGGDEQAHDGQIFGVLPVDKYLVSWGQDGAIRFWSREGDRLPGGDDQAHMGFVLGILPVDQQLVSWGEDGAIRSWSPDGTPLELIAVPGGLTSVWRIGHSRIMAFGRSVWVYDLDSQR